MNILMLADIVPYPPNTGIKIRTYNIAKQLARGGDNVYLVCFNHQVFLSQPEQKAQVRRELEKFCAEVHILEIPSDRNPVAAAWAKFANLFQSDPFRVRRYFTQECVDLIRDIQARCGVDLFHLDKTEFHIYTQYLPDVPAVPTNHNVESRLFRRRAKYEVGFLRRFFAGQQYHKTERYEKMALGSVPGYIVCTDVDRDYFRQELGISTPVEIVDNGVDVEAYRPLPGHDRYFLIIGAQCKDATANYDATIFFMEEIWPEARKLGVPLKIVGRDPDPIIRRWGEQDELVEVIGFVEDEREVLGRALALLVPLRVGGGSRLKILTAMAMGTPVLSTRIGAEGIECEHGLDVLLADEPGEFGAAMERLARDDAQRDEIGRQARLRAERRYDWNLIGDRMKAFYRSLLQGDAS